MMPAPLKVRNVFLVKEAQYPLSPLKSQPHLSTCLFISPTLALHAFHSSLPRLRVAASGWNNLRVSRFFTTCGQRATIRGPIAAHPSRRRFVRAFSSWTSFPATTCDRLFARCDLWLGFKPRIFLRPSGRPPIAMWAFEIAVKFSRCHAGRVRIRGRSAVRHRARASASRLSGRYCGRERRWCLDSER